MTISKSFCIMPWTGISTEASGGYRPCCWMEGPLHLYREPLETYEQSSYLNDMKNHFLNGTYPAACKRCQWNDENGIVSKRQRENKKWLEKNNIEDYESAVYTIVDLRLNNKCNLSCVSCGPKSSSSIYDEVEKNYDNHLLQYKKTYSAIKNINLANPYSDKDIDILVGKINKNSRVYFTGGEPTLVKPAFEVLDKLIDKGLHEQITVEFNSNFQALNKKWIEQLKHFRGLMMPSIDATGDQAELIRYGSKWKDVDSNFRYFLNECEGFNIKIWPTISSLNLLYIKNVINWAESFNSNRITISLDNRLSYPDWLDIKNLPDNLKDKARKYLGDEPIFKDILTHLNNPSNLTAQQEFSVNMDNLDKIRGTNWRGTLNEIADGWE